MNNQDISKYEQNDRSQLNSTEQDVAEYIFNLLNNESFAVLSTQADGKPHGSLVAFAFEKDMRTFVFGTPTGTRKYRNLKRCNQVALVVDSRAHVSNDINRVEAVTITGEVLELKDGLTYDRLTRIFIERHPYLKSFIGAWSTAFFAVNAEDFAYVTRFQSVYHWRPVLVS